MLDPQLQNNFHNFGFILESMKDGSYVGIFLLSIFVSYLLPLPEVVLLLLIGFIAQKTGIRLGFVIAISVAGSIIGDNALYRLSFFGNRHIERFKRKMRTHKLIRYEHLVVDNIGKTIFFLRFVTGVRFFGPVISGTLGVGWKKFFSYNAAATALHGTAFILLGFFMQHRIFSTIAEVEIVRNALLFSSVFIVAALIRIFSSKKEIKAC